MKRPQLLQNATLSRLLALSLALSQATVIPAAHAAPDTTSFLKDQSPTTLGAVSEFVYKTDLDEALIPVYLLGAVNRPGLYHVPARTDLVTLLAISGGATKEADLTDVKIKKQPNNNVTQVDLDKVVSEEKLRAPMLSSNDVILVQTKEPAISNNTVAVVGIVAGVLGIIVSGILINQQLKR